MYRLPKRTDPWMIWRAPVLWVCLGPLASATSAQGPLGHLFWVAYQAKADSVVRAHFGAAFTQQHVFRDDPSDLPTSVGNGLVSGSTRDSISQVPDWCAFAYRIGLDSSHAASEIYFALNPHGEPAPIVWETPTDWQGFVACESGCSFKYDLNGFRKVAEENRVRRSRDLVFHDLTWVQPVPIDGFRAGRYELVLARYRGREYHRALSSKHSYKVYDIVVFDPFSGVLLRTERDLVKYKISCGAPIGSGRSPNF